MLPGFSWPAGKPETRTHPHRVGDHRFASNDGIATPRDIASDDNESSSSSEADVLTSLAKRRAELDAKKR